MTDTEKMNRHCRMLRLMSYRFEFTELAKELGADLSNDCDIIVVYDLLQVRIDDRRRVRGEPQF